MGFVKKRLGRDGKPRYTACYLDIRGRQRSAGTFATKKQATEAWKKSEADIRAGRQGDPGRGRQTFETYVLQKWLPHHQLEPGVRADYEGQIRRQLLEHFGPMKMRDIMPEHVRALGHLDERPQRRSPDHPVLQDVDPERDLHYCAGR